jgi:hypothetical protein
MLVIIVPCYRVLIVWHVARIVLYRPCTRQFVAVPVWARGRCTPVRHALKAIEGIVWEARHRLVVLVIGTAHPIKRLHANVPEFLRIAGRQLGNGLAGQLIEEIRCFFP